MSESIDNNIEVNEEEIYIEEIDLEAIGKQFESQTLVSRVKMLVRGLKAPAGSREYKEALIEIQRLLAPVGAIIIPLVFIAMVTHKNYYTSFSVKSQWIIRIFYFGSNF